MKAILYAAVAAAALVPAAAMANGRTQSGTTSDGLTWTAQSHIVGQVSTATLPPASTGNPAYLATNAQGYSGVVGLLMTYDNNTAFVCSGALTAGNRIVTAAHCVSDGFNAGPNGKAPGLVSTRAFFSDGSSADPHFYSSPPGVTSVEVAAYHINSGYTGEVIDQNDIAVLTLASAAPKYAQVYDLFTSDINGSTFNVAGLGTRSLVGGAEGTTGLGAGAGTGRRRQGDNVYDFRLGEFYGDIGGTAEFEYSYLSDFDNGNPLNDSGCLLFGRCGAFQGLKEVSIAGGDSGGPGFINGKLASVNSYGLTFGRFCLVDLVNGACPGPIGGDFKPGLQSSWGEMNGFVPVFIHESFIAGVPEPSTWAMLILGFGVAGAAMRRKSKVQARYAF